VGLAEQRTEPQPGIVRLVGGQCRGDRAGGVQQRADVGAGQPGRNQAERGERAVPATDVRIGQEHLAVAGVLGHLLQRRAGIGDHHDPGLRVDALLGERLLIRPPMRIGLDGAAGLAGHHQHRAIQPVGDRGTNLAGIGGVQRDQLDTGGLADHLGCQ
jgi:hypothetical protein